MNTNQITLSWTFLSEQKETDQSKLYGWFNIARWQETAWIFLLDGMNSARLMGLPKKRTWFKLGRISRV